MSENKMTKEDSSRIQSSQAKGGNDMSSTGFAARAQAAGDRADNASSDKATQGSGSDSGSAGNSGKANASNK
ncbi:hypothetical protein DSL72_001490 [Monilinia vaccinii-corymbosi]|uniref:SMP domain-containing protein n=1 Tax=Monilinia vaccinii-corymbosi TaxID=61207 RepID=A0A8A3P7U4_9HELO|nr:hypothetical protein DSL72_001490 [Monilinia vaccinii-corymbosi]